MLNMAALLCFLALSSEFGTAPISAEFEEGQKVFKHKKGIDRTEKDARVVIGKWFDGDRLQLVEEAIFVTPGLLSRWLGYKEASGTAKDEVQASWKQCSAQFTGKTVTLIRLARLGTVEPHDGDTTDTAKTDAIDNPKIEIRQVGKEWHKMTYHVVQDLLDRHPADVLKETWDQILAKFTAFPSTPTENDLMPELRWGRNRRISMLTEVPTLDPGSKSELKIVEKDRTRVIAFDFPKS